MPPTHGAYGPDEEYFRRHEAPRPTRVGVPAPWGRRAFALGIDIVLEFWPLLLIPLARAFDLTDDEGTPTGTGGEIMFTVALLGTVALVLWNMVREGRTGESFGKTVAGIQTLGLKTGRPPGLMIVFRHALRPVNSMFCFLGYLWPLWDEQSQTFVDKIVGTVVVDTET